MWVPKTLTEMFIYLRLLKRKFMSQRRVEQGDSGDSGDSFLLGDDGYSCRNCLLTPLLNPRTHAELKYQAYYLYIL